MKRAKFSFPLLAPLLLICSGRSDGVARGRCVTVANILFPCLLRLDGRWSSGIFGEDFPR